MGKAFSSYTGFHNGNYLRSSYEYAFARYLEKLNIPYAMELHTYELSNGTRYKPDFFILNNGIVVEIVEIKSEHKDRLEEGKVKVNLIKEIIDVPINMYTRKDLVILCKEVGLHFYTLEKEWKESPTTSKNHILDGELNPMYGVKHREDSLRKNGNKTIDRFKDEEFREKHKLATMEAMKYVDKSKLGHPKQRVTKICKNCGCEFVVISTSKKQYCGTQCMQKAMTIRASEKSKVITSQRNEIIKGKILDWASQNKYKLSTFSRISLSKEIKPLFDEILLEYKFKDYRPIFSTLTGEYQINYTKLLSLLKIY